MRAQLPSSFLKMKTFGLVKCLLGFVSCTYCIRRFFVEAAFQLAAGQCPQRARFLHATAHAGNDEIEPMSHISVIRCNNIAGVQGEKGGEIKIDLQSYGASNLVAVTGETGHGKSLLFTKMVDLVSGGKASSSLIQDPAANSSAFVEVSLKIFTTNHLEMIKHGLKGTSFDPKVVLGMDMDVDNDDTNGLPVTLTLKRSFYYKSSPGKPRLKSICYINNTQVPLKVLKTVGSLLLSVVNAPLAANTLRQPASRTAILDAGVPSSILERVNIAWKEYTKNRKYREMLDKQLKERVLPREMVAGEELDEGILRHWVEELDAFGKRMTAFTSLFDTGASGVEDSNVGRQLDEIAALSWISSDNSGNSKLYAALLDLVEHLNSLDSHVKHTVEASRSIDSLSASDSARTAVERVRQILMDFEGEGAPRKSPVSCAVETTHELLNGVENSLTSLAAGLDDLLEKVEDERNSCPVSSDLVLEYIMQWKDLSRKHGVSPYSLPLCHQSLRRELDGNVEAMQLLPLAISAEEKSLAELKKCRDVLRTARIDVAGRLSHSVSERLTALGMDSRFVVQVQACSHSEKGSPDGPDRINFFVFHKNEGDADTGESLERGGEVDIVASAGEKARILLAIECEIPGAIRASCNSAKAIFTERDSSEVSYPVSIAHRPLVCIYDEIDAHVGVSSYQKKTRCPSFIIVRTQSFLFSRVMHP